jgi:hypothetical protein
MLNPHFMTPPLPRTSAHTTLGKLRVSELLFEVPKDYTNPERGTIQLFARSVGRHEKPAAVPTEEERRKRAQKPWYVHVTAILSCDIGLALRILIGFFFRFVYLQGGPGFGCAAPQNAPITNTILDKGYQLLYLDQRGTGLSSPITAATLALQGDAHRQADYLKLFRADSIVKDCEAIRKTLTHDYPAELKVQYRFGS